MRSFILIFAFVLMSLSTIAQVEKSSELYLELKKNDSLIFDASFNTCNLDLLKTLIHDDLEFYHDKSGMINGKKEFLESTINGLCKSPYKLKRALLLETMKVFPLNDRKGELYAAIQIGTHQFFQDNEQTGTAYFTHLWVFESEKWLLKRVLSYNHIAMN